MSQQDLPPDLGDRYTILSLLGAGGMGRVYLAHDAKQDRRIAIKVLNSDIASMVGAQRFLREIRIASGLTHPNIVPLYESGEWRGHLFFVMPYLEGESLRQRLKTESMLPLPQVLEWATEINEGLAFLHGHGIVHRDIKPENIIIQAGHVLIADFGIARAIDAAAGEGITSEQLVLGTPVYMSPEQATGAIRVDGRSDIYSLACVVYEMLAGEPPFGGASPQAVTAKKLSGHYPSLLVVRPTVPRALERALARALEPIAADRFPTAEEFSKALHAVAKTTTSRVLRGLLVLGLLGAVGGLAMSKTLRKSTERVTPSRIVVGMFENRTGDAQYDPLSFMAADWVTEGLQRTGAVDVVPTLTALAATRFLKTMPDTLDPVRALARETGAELVVSGSIYRDRDSLVLQAQLASAKAGRLVGAVEPLRTVGVEVIDALQQLRIRLMGLLALSLDDRIIQGERPPTYPAYQAFSTGMDAYVRNDYGLALAAFKRSHTADTSFMLPLLYASFCHLNLGDFAAADSLLAIAAAQRDRLNPHDQFWLDYQRAELAGKESEALAAIRRAAELAPGSKAAYNFAVRALEARQPFPAESALRQLSPDVGPMRGWLPYWDVLTHALHAQRKHRSELKASREASRRFPDRIEAYLPEGRALAAGGRLTDLEHFWLQLNGRPEATRLQLGALAFEVGSELWAHADSTMAPPWLTRSYEAFVSAGRETGSAEARWGRARAAARLGRFREALDLCEELTAGELNRPDYWGLLGILSARLGDRLRAQSVLQRLADDNRPYTYGRPQYQAGRIAAALGDLGQATELLARAKTAGYTYDPELHRDPILAPLRHSAIMRQLEPGTE